MREPSAAAPNQIGMIAHDDLVGGVTAAVEAALLEEPLVTAAQGTIDAFTVTSDLLEQIGQLVVEYGQGKPLAIYQSLLATYQTLIDAQGAIAVTAQAILAHAEGSLAEQPAIPEVAG